MAISKESRVGDLVRDRFARSAVFAKHGVDFCCGGRKTLAEACRAAECEPETVIHELQESDEAAGETDTTDWSSESLTALTRHLVEVHHGYMKRELPRIGEMLAKVLDAHGENHPELREVQDVFAGLRGEIEGHLMKEEQVLFPLIQQMEATRQPGEAHCGSVNNPIGVMEREHDNAGEALRRLRRLTGGYVAPEDACLTYEALLAALAAMESDLHEHIHKENNILHPRAVQLEAALLESAAQES